jgi:hypothetical protein
MILIFFNSREEEASWSSNGCNVKMVMIIHTHLDTWYGLKPLKLLYATSYKSLMAQPTGLIPETH